MKVAAEERHNILDTRDDDLYLDLNHAVQRGCGLSQVLDEVLAEGEKIIATTLSFLNGITETQIRSHRHSIPRIQSPHDEVLTKTTEAVITLPSEITPSQKRTEGAQQADIAAHTTDPAAVSRLLASLGRARLTRTDSYVDVSMLRDPGLKEEARGGYWNFFPEKLHLLLESVERNGQARIASWCPHGRAFKIHDSIALMEILPAFFTRQQHINSFTRQLGLNGFLRVMSGPDQDAYYHPLFLRGE